MRAKAFFFLSLCIEVLLQTSRWNYVIFIDIDIKTMHYIIQPRNVLYWTLSTSYECGTIAHAIHFTFAAYKF